MRLAVLDELFALFDGSTKDCDLIAARVEEYAGRNLTRFSVLAAYGKSHPDAEQLVQHRLQPRVSQLTNNFMTVLSPCMQNQRLVKAFETLSQNAQQFQQRPR